VGLVEAGEAAEVVVVDNASTDGTATAVRDGFPGVRLLAQRENLGAVGRTVGVAAVSSPVVAFADDDSWWAPGALPLAARLFAEHPRLALVHGRVVVEPGGADDDACARLAAGPQEPGLPGPSVIAHLACGAVVRREAFLAAGGYSDVLGFGGEEALLALDLAATGWQQCYVPAVVAHHQPSEVRDDWPVRWARYRRNDTLTALLRLPAGFAARETARLLRQAAGDPVVRRELGPFLRRLPAVARQRRRVPEPVWQQFRASRGLA
jgi:GT2 family glycosyltransferase